ncbi:dicer-like protein, partial [Aureobasidium melanogenum]
MSVHSSMRGGFCFLDFGNIVCDLLTQGVVVEEEMFVETKSNTKSSKKLIGYHGHFVFSQPLGILVGILVEEMGDTGHVEKGSDRRDVIRMLLFHPLGQFKRGSSGLSCLRSGCHSPGLSCVSKAAPMSASETSAIVLSPSACFIGSSPFLLAPLPLKSLIPSGYHEAVTQEFKALVVLAHTTLKIDSFVTLMIFCVVRVLSNCFQGQWQIYSQSKLLARLLGDKIVIDAMNDCWEHITSRYDGSRELSLVSLTFTHEQIVLTADMMSGSGHMKLRTFAASCASLTVGSASMLRLCNIFSASRTGCSRFQDLMISACRLEATQPSGTGSEGLYSLATLVEKKRRPPSQGSMKNLSTRKVIELLSFGDCVRCPSWCKLVRVTFWDDHFANETLTLICDDGGAKSDFCTGTRYRMSRVEIDHFLSEDQIVVAVQLTVCRNLEFLRLARPRDFRNIKAFFGDRGREKAIQLSFAELYESNHLTAKGGLPARSAALLNENDATIFRRASIMGI